MINFEEKLEKEKEADKILNDILEDKTFCQCCKISKIDDLEIAKMIIRKLVRKVEDGGKNGN